MILILIKKKIYIFKKLINWNILLINNKKSIEILFSNGEWKIN